MRLLLLLLVAVCVTPATVHACSYEAGYEPTCPAGQVFDGADLCKCVDAPAVAPTPTVSETSYTAYDIVIHTPDEFKACKESSECILLAGACGSPQAINTSHTELYRKSVRQVAMTINCSDDGAFNPADYTASCQSNACTVSHTKMLD